MHIELDISNSKLRYDAGEYQVRVAASRNYLTLSFCYHPGDHVAVYPINDSALVNKFGELLGVDLDTVITLLNIDGTSFFISTCPEELLLSSVFFV